MSAVAGPPAWLERKAVDSDPLMVAGFTKIQGAVRLPNVKVVHDNLCISFLLVKLGLWVG